MSPKVKDIPGLEALIATNVTPGCLSAVANYVGDLWRSAQGERVAVPRDMSINLANEICSLVLAYRERISRTGGSVEIKKVAEIRGSRFNTGKPRFDLIDGLAMEGLAQVLTKGAVKYAAHNWRNGMPYMEVIASLERHIAKIKQGEDIDSETGEFHADHIQCNAMFLSNMMKTRPDMDDRVATQMNLRQPLAGDSNQSTTFGSNTGSS